MSLEDAIVYKKHFRDPSEGFLPEAVEEWGKQKRSYAHAEPLFEDLLTSLGEISGAQVSTSEKSGRAFASVSIGDYMIIASGTSSKHIQSLSEQVLENLKRGGNLIFIRHAYAPGGGDPDNFKINDCSTQRNLNDSGRKQAKKIGNFFKNNQIPIDKVISSEWCRCKETAEIAFGKYKVKNFLNSFFSEKFSGNKKKQMRDLKKFIKE